jgi:hypothetical protein
VERRGHGTGQVSHVACRSCAAPLLLDPAAMTTSTEGTALRCPACGGTVPVRRSDTERIAPPAGDVVASHPEPAALDLRHPELAQRAVHATAAPGWYPNPDLSGGLRYFDGQRWTDRVKARGQAPSPPPSVLPPAPQAPLAAPAPEQPPPTRAAELLRRWPPRQTAAAVGAGIALGLVIGLAVGSSSSHHPPTLRHSPASTSQSKTAVSPSPTTGTTPPQAAHASAPGVTLALTP